MAAPYPRRGVQQGQARALNRGARGQAGGRFGGLSPSSPRATRATRNDTPPTESALTVPVGWVTYRKISQVVAGSAALVMDTLYDTEGDVSWLTDNMDGSWSIDQAGFYEFHCYASTSAAITLGNCVRIQPNSGADYPHLDWLALPYLGISGSVSSARIAAGSVTKVVTADEAATGPVTFQVVHIGAAATISTYLDFVKVI